jgi:(2R)-sulfolactate sulfo-lyase subunit alpha
LGRFLVKPKALVHARDDWVAVATEDISNGEEFAAVDMDDGHKSRTISSKEAILLGHKIALKHIAKGEHVIEYGEVIGMATKDIDQGQHVHTHNLKSLRW